MTFAERDCLSALSSCETGRPRSNLRNASVSGSGGEDRLQKGLILRYDPNWIAFAPPLIIENNEIDTMMNTFSESLEEMLAVANPGKSIATPSRS